MHKCDRCGKRATYVRVTEIPKFSVYGNPYLPRKVDTWVERRLEYACRQHFAAAAKLSICGPHRWREVNA